MVTLLVFRYDLGIMWGLLEMVGGQAVGSEKSARTIGGKERR